MSFILLDNAIVGRAKLNVRNYRRAVSPASVLFVREVVPAVRAAQVIVVVFFQLLCLKQTFL
jgi:hypothetical protein